MFHHLFRILIGFGLLLSGLPVASAKIKRHEAPHVHGEAVVDLGIEANQGNIHFKIDTHSLTGFEHTPKTQEEKKSVDHVYQVFRSQMEQMFSLDSKLGCHWQEKKLLIAAESEGDHDEPSHEGHQALNGDFDLKCAKKIVPSTMQVHLKKYFEAIQKIKIQIVTDTGARAVELPGAGSVSLE